MQFRISELAQRDIINLVDGARLGPVKDVYIDLEAGRCFPWCWPGKGSISNC